MAYALTQLPLELKIPLPALNFEQFEHGENLSVVMHLRDIIHRRGAPSLYLYGAPGCGKTHLLQAACDEIAQQGGVPVFLPLTEIEPEFARATEGLEHADLVCVDDVQLLAGHAEHERALFGLFNQLREQGVPLVVSGSALPVALPFLLPDLVSRLNWGGVFQILLPDKLSKQAIVDAYARQLGLHIAPKIMQTLVHTGPAELDGLKQCVEELNRLSLAMRRKISMAMVHKLIRNKQQVKSCKL